MKRISADDLPVLTRQFTDRWRHSIFALQSAYGYSSTELEAVFEENPPLLFADESAQERSLLLLSDIDTRVGHARVQICGQPPASWLINVREMLLPVDVVRLYSFVFPEETSEIQALGRAGINLEVMFRQHVYMAGRFRDLHVYGWLRPEK